jgi:hypothetical protein
VSDEADDGGELLVKPKKDKGGPLHHTVTAAMSATEKRAAKAFFESGPQALLPKAPRPPIRVKR